MGATAWLLLSGMGMSVLSQLSLSVCAPSGVGKGGPLQLSMGVPVVGAGMSSSGTVSMGTWSVMFLAGTPAVLPPLFVLLAVAGWMEVVGWLYVSLA